MAETHCGNHVIQYPGEYSLCLGCESCELICSLVHDGVAGLGRSGIVLQRDQLKGVTHKILTCQHCGDHPCYEACPKKGEAMFLNEKGVVCINADACIGCKRCAKACVFVPSRITVVDRKAHKCDLCNGRAEGPACVEHCPALCIGLSADPLPYNNIGQEEKQ